MDIVFVRHGVPDYSLSDERKMGQLEKDYAPLNRDFLPEIHAMAKEIELEKADIILSSPYTRALQTAEIINRTLGLDLFVEHDLREWRADLAGGYITLRERDRRWHEYRDSLKHSTTLPTMPYESVTELNNRAVSVLSRYKHVSKVIVVSHFNVLESLVGYQEVGIECGSYRSFTLGNLGE